MGREASLPSSGSSPSSERIAVGRDLRPCDRSRFDRPPRVFLRKRSVRLTPRGRQRSGGAARAKPGAAIACRANALKPQGFGTIRIGHTGLNLAPGDGG